MSIFDFTSTKDKDKFLNNVVTPFLTEMILEDPFKRYMGDSGNSMIMKKSSLAKGDGTQITYSLTYNGLVNEVYGEETLEGKGTMETPVNCTMNIGETRFAVGAKDFKIAEFQTKFKFNDTINEQLRIKSTLLSKRRHINQFAWCFAYGSKGADDNKSYEYGLKKGQATSAFSTFFTPKIKDCSINQLDASLNGISSDRVLFGAEPINNLIAAGQTVQQRCIVGNPALNQPNIGTADYADGTSGYCNLDHIDKLIDMARKGGRKMGNEATINPMFYQNYKGHSGFGYTYFISPRVRTRLLKSPLFKELMIRPFREDGQPTYFNGTEYIGRIRNVDIVVVDEFEYLEFTTQANVEIGYSAFCGAGAYTMAICTQPMFTDQYFDHKKGFEIGVTMLDGMKVVKFPSKKYGDVATFPRVEHGIIHSFTLI